MKKNEVYTELSIQIGVLEAKVDKILQILLDQQKPNIIDTQFIGIGEGFDSKRLHIHLSKLNQVQTDGIVDDETFREEFK